MTPNELDTFLRDVAWIDSRGHGFILYGIARAMARTRGWVKALEIGVRAGGTTVPLLAGLVAGAETVYLTSVDNGSEGMDHIEAAQRIVRGAGLEKHWTFVLADSQSFQPEDTYDLILIDANHSFENVVADFNRYAPFLSEAGLMLLHDAEWGGVAQLVDALGNAWMVSVLPFYYGLAIIHRRRDWPLGQLPPPEGW